MTHAEKRKLEREVEEWLINMLGPIEIEDLEEAAEVIQKTLEEFVVSEIAERSN